MAGLSLRIEIDPNGRIGPGKIALLERVDEHGSIAAAGRSLGMSYKRAWALIDEMNQCFGKPVVATQMGGRDGGGSALTPFGRDLIAHYRAIETKAHKAVALHLEALQAVVFQKN